MGKYQYIRQILPFFLNNATRASATDQKLQRSLLWLDDPIHVNRHRCFLVEKYKMGAFQLKKKNDFTLSSAWTNQYVMIFLSSSCAASHEDQRCHKIWRNFVILFWSSPYSFFPKLDMGQVFMFLIFLHIYCHLLFARQSIFPILRPLWSVFKYSVTMNWSSKKTEVFSLQHGRTQWASVHD